ncbi:type II secretion system protein J [uncultured Amnibacterium sp.]|uniref:PulJ/GspJ family protein n=1 Tax=uncultured Amnibacterium sp. TaxID=1631851 RepID=UPI0035CB9A46
MSTGRRIADADAGLTMVELIVASTVGLLLLSLMGTMFVQITRTVSDAQLTKAATAIAWNVADEITRVVRQGVRVTTSSSTTEGAVVAGSSPTSLIIDSNVDAAVTPGLTSIAPTRVTFTVNAAGNLIESRQASTLTSGYFAFGASTTRAVNGPISTAGTGTDALFVYWTGPNDAPVQVVPSSGGLTAAQAIQVNAVTVNVSVDVARSTGADPVKLTNKVTMPNIAIVTGGN